MKGKRPDNFKEKPKDGTNTTDVKKLNPENLLDTEDNVDPQDEKVDNDHQESKSDWDKRILCSDGNCIGIVGSDGKCNDCGRLYKKDKE